MFHHGLTGSRVAETTDRAVGVRVIAGDTQIMTCRVVGEALPLRGGMRIRTPVTVGDAHPLEMSAKNPGAGMTGIAVLAGKAGRHHCRRCFCLVTAVGLLWKVSVLMHCNEI